MQNGKGELLLEMQSVTPVACIICKVGAAIRAHFLLSSPCTALGWPLVDPAERWPHAPLPLAIDAPACAEG